MDYDQSEDARNIKAHRTTENGPTHKVNGSEAAVADLTEVSEQLLGIIFAEEICHLRILEIACPCTRGHGQGLEEGERGSVRGGGTLLMIENLEKT